MTHCVYQFGEFKLDCGRFELSRNGYSIKLERKPLELLILLASSDGRLLTRNEIARRLWDSEVFVDTEHGINTAIRKIRQALRDEPEEPRFVQTVTRMGYRFVCPVETSGQAFGQLEEVVELNGFAKNGALNATANGSIQGAIFTPPAEIVDTAAEESRSARIGTVRHKRLVKGPF